MFFAAWSLRTLFETAWIIAPSSFLGSTFGIANNDNTEDDQKEEKGGAGWGDIEHDTHMTISKKLIGRAIVFVLIILWQKKTWMTNEMAIRTRW